jgi:hypothetical protein
MSIGVVVFLILFLYIVIKVGIYLTKPQLTIFEVQEGATAANKQFTALILRQEDIVNSDKIGYITSFQRDGARIAKDAPLFSINSTLVYSEDKKDADSENLSEKNIAQIKHEVKNYINNYSDDNFGAVYDFQDNMKSTVIDIKNNNMVTGSGQASDTNTTIPGAVLSQESGIVTYYRDGFESVTSDSFTADMFKPDMYKRINLRTTDKINQNTPVCKIIRSDNWNLVIPLKKEQYDKLIGKERITITVIEDELKLTGDLQLVTKGSRYYGILTLNKNMSNYIKERYLDIEMNFDSIDGLKIPLTSLVKKDFYEVPKDYFVQGGDSNEMGLSKVVYGQDGKISYQHVQTDIYYREGNNYYIDTDLFVPGTKIQANGKNEQYTLSKTIKLTGVYNVNQGYAIFKRVEILTTPNQGDEYCIIKKDTADGLAAFDHIALDSKIAVEQKIIY